MKEWSEACARNQDPILDVLREAFADRRHVLEIGSGTGQHAVHFARHLPHLRWQTSDLPVHHAGINAWLAEANLSNLSPPLAIDLRREEWGVASVDAVFCANVVHIVAWELVQAFFRGLGRHLPPDGRVCLYGPYNYGGRFTAPSNAQFDRWLKARDPASGIRDFEAVDALARAEGLSLFADIEMPANNRCLLWRRG